MIYLSDKMPNNYGNSLRKRAYCIYFYCILPLECVPVFVYVLVSLPKGAMGLVCDCGISRTY